jgi:hypothetical protein
MFKYNKCLLLETLFASFSIVRRQIHAIGVYFFFVKPKTRNKMILLGLCLMEDVKDDFAKTRQVQYKWQF